jgi:hypothetical protein
VLTMAAAIFKLAVRRKLATSNADAERAFKLDNIDHLLLLIILYAL